MKHLISTLDRLTIEAMLRLVRNDPGHSAELLRALEDRAAELDFQLEHAA